MFDLTNAGRICSMPTSTLLCAVPQPIHGHSCLCLMRSFGLQGSYRRALGLLQWPSMLVLLVLPNGNATLSVPWTLLVALQEAEKRKRQAQSKLREACEQSPAGTEVPTNLGMHAQT